MTIIFDMSIDQSNELTLEESLGQIRIESRQFFFLKDVKYILLAIFSPFLWSLNKVWPFNPTTS